METKTTFLEETYDKIKKIPRMKWKNGNKEDSCAAHYKSYPRRPLLHLEIGMVKQIFDSCLTWIDGDVEKLLTSKKREKKNYCNRNRGEKVIWNQCNGMHDIQSRLTLMESFVKEQNKPKQTFTEIRRCSKSIC